MTGQWSAPNRAREATRVLEGNSKMMMVGDVV
jgi:hypothetical protein